MQLNHYENDRVLFLDNLRDFIVLLVVVLHSGYSYSFFKTYWPDNDENSVVFNLLLAFLQVFLMPILFFISGYFALPSLKRRTTSFFIVAKFKRLGIPLD